MSPQLSFPLIDGLDRQLWGKRLVMARLVLSSGCSQSLTQANRPRVGPCIFAEMLLRGHAIRLLQVTLLKSLEGRRETGGKAVKGCPIDLSHSQRSREPSAGLSLEQREALAGGGRRLAPVSAPY